MKVEMIIDFVKVAGKKIPIGDNNIKLSMQYAIRKLVESIKKFYHDYKIEVEITYKILEEDDK